MVNLFSSSSIFVVNISSSSSIFEVNVPSPPSPFSIVITGGQLAGGEELDGGSEQALVEGVERSKEGGSEEARRREWGGGWREVEELPAELDVELERELDVEEVKEEGGMLAVSFLDPGGELQREPRGETETPESQLSFRLRLPPPRPGAGIVAKQAQQQYEHRHQQDH